jgi:uncharacterized protein with NRDE domain
VLAGDAARGAFFHASNRDAGLTRIAPGIHGLSNATLDTPWPKVVALGRSLEDAARSSESARALAWRLHQALLDDRLAPDASLPDTGVGLENERLLSSAFIRTPDGTYGTRSSTIVIRERRHGFVFEWSYGPDGDVIDEREVVLETWPASGRIEPTARLP